MVVQQAQNLYAMLAEEKAARSAPLSRKSSALTFLLAKFKTQRRSFGYQQCRPKGQQFKTALRIARPLGPIKKIRIK